MTLGKCHMLIRASLVKKIYEPIFKIALNYAGCYQCDSNLSLIIGGLTYEEAASLGGNTTSNGIGGYWYSNNSMTIDMCITSCIARNYLYAGLYDG